MKLIRTTLVTALALMATAYIVPGFTVQSFGIAIVAALVLGLVNAVIRPLMLLLTLPINILTLGLFTWVINALMIGLAAFFVGGFAVSGFLPALLGSLVVSLVSSLLNSILES